MDVALVKYRVSAVQVNIFTVPTFISNYDNRNRVLDRRWLLNVQNTSLLVVKYWSTMIIFQQSDWIRKSTFF